MLIETYILHMYCVFLSFKKNQQSYPLKLDNITKHTHLPNLKP